jgi:hypothetical protein
VTGEVRDITDGVGLVDTRAVQDGAAIIRNAEAELRLG